MSQAVDIFKQATKLKLRFSSVRGDLTVEDLWDLPLTSKSNLSLDGVGKPIQKALRESDEDSLVAVPTTSKNELNSLRLAVIKEIISVKQEENLIKQNQAAVESQKALLKQALASKKVDEINSLSVEEIEKRLASM